MNSNSQDPVNIFALTRRWWDFAFANPSKVKPIHSALYFFAIEHCNRMGWKREFGFPTVMAMEAMGVSSYNTYKNGLNDLVDWGFIIMVERSRNQYSANIIALSYFDKAHDKARDEALDKAVLRHATKHVTKHSRGMSDIDIPRDQETKRQIHSSVSDIDGVDDVGVGDEGDAGAPVKNEHDDSGFADWFWPTYDYPIAKAKCRQKWMRLSRADRQRIRDHLPGYIADTVPRPQHGGRSDKRIFRMHPMTYLNQKIWTDDPKQTTTTLAGPASAGYGKNQATEYDRDDSEAFS